MSRYKLKAVRSVSDIPVSMRKTPFGELLRYHNLGEPFKKYDAARIIVCMCMDNRKQLRLPDNFAFKLRTGGGNIRHSEFKVSYAIGIGGVKHVAMIAHDNCGMSGLVDRRAGFIKGMVKNAGWTEKRASEYFAAYAPFFEIGDETEFVVAEARRLNHKYPKVKVLPLFYKLADGRLYLIDRGR